MRPCAPDCRWQRCRDRGRSPACPCPPCRPRSLSTTASVDSRPSRSHPARPWSRSGCRLRCRGTCRTRPRHAAVRLRALPPFAARAAARATAARAPEADHRRTWEPPRRAGGPCPDQPCSIRADAWVYRRSASVSPPRTRGQHRAPARSCRALSWWRPGSPCSRRHHLRDRVLLPPQPAQTLAQPPASTPPPGWDLFQPGAAAAPAADAPFVVPGPGPEAGP
mmetsp:Transcript_93214/g.266444  ORF Transcript_93214/g.266444 Transcript_93214/m.266444 type:complete len:222 (+) Transcript_93214:492-1157(+)